VPLNPLGAGLTLVWLFHVYMLHVMQIHVQKHDSVLWAHSPV
jgi:hypothetical protein